MYFPIYRLSILVLQLNVIVGRKPAVGFLRARSIPQKEEGMPKDIVTWEEEIDEEHVKPTKPKGPKRSIIWWSGSFADRIQKRKRPKKHKPHPLRTDEWKLRVQWRGTNNNEDLFLEFADNGYLRIHPQNATTSWIGSWELMPSGLSWKLPLGVDADEFLFYADLHLNPFGEQPKLTRGVILSTKSIWFRPVVATFHGVGVGKDTADLSYRHRGFGLYKEPSEKQ